MAGSKETTQAQLPYSPDLEKTFQLARNIAEMDNTDIGINYLTLAVTSRLGLNNTENILNRLSISLNAFFENVITIAKIEARLAKPHLQQERSLTTHSRQAMSLSTNLAKNSDAQQLETEHLLIGMATYADRFMRQHRINPRHK